MNASNRSTLTLRLAVLAGLAATAMNAVALAAPPTAGSKLDLGGIDHAVAPGNDFYRYANGAWIATAVIPPDRSSFGPDAVLSELTDRRMEELIRPLAEAKELADPDARKVGDFFAAYMDEAGIEAKGLEPVRPALDRIAAISSRVQLASVLGSTLRADVDALNNTNFETDNLFGLWVAADLDEPSRYSAFLLQGGLDLPDREYYLDPAQWMAEIRVKYQAHVAAILKAAHLADAETRAARIFALEKQIAKAHWPREDSGNVRKANNHWARTDFEKRAPGLDWQAFFSAAGLERQTRFVVWQPSALIGIAALAGSQPLQTWQDYLTFHALERLAGSLPKAFVEERFAFHGKVLSGTPKLRERWKRAIGTTNFALPDAVGKLYVQRYFPAAEKARAEAMVANLVKAFGQRIDKLEWMTPETKKKARAKLATLRVSVGYPEKWVDYSGLEISRTDAYGNVARAELFEYRRNLAKLDKPVDRTEWAMKPQEINALNLPVMNALNFPAAILQPPHFDAARPAAMDYGDIGATIGHEISHSFDDQGALFDASGRLHNWWTKADLAHFEGAAARLVKQYDAYRPFPDLCVKGQQTLSENIADLAGLAVAYDAYKLSLGGQPAPVVDGMTGDQLFFLSYARSWREKAREPELRQQIMTDCHSPAEYRAATVRNLDSWVDAFAVKAGQTMFLPPAERIRVW